jgi:hypothetical protein
MHCVLQLIYPAMLPFVVVVQDVLAAWYFLKRSAHNINYSPQGLQM